MKKKGMKLVSYLLTIAILVTSIQVSALAETIDGITDDVVIGEVENATQEQTVSGNDEEIAPVEDVSEGDESGDTSEDISEETEEDEEETEDVSDGDEISAEGEDELETMDVGTTITGKIAITIGGKSKIYTNDDIATGLASLAGVSSATVTLKSNITTADTLNFNSGNVTLDLGKFKITSTHEKAPAVKTNGSTVLTIKGTGSIVAQNEAIQKSVMGTLNVSANSIVYIDGGTISGVSDTVKVYGTYASVLIRGGKIVATLGSAVSVSDHANVQMTGGTLEGATAVDVRGEEAFFRVSGGKLVAKKEDGDAYGIRLVEGVVRAVGGNISVSGKNAYGIMVDDSYDIDSGMGTLYVQGGTVKVTGTNSAVGIATKGTTGEMYQYGGNFTVKAGKTAYGYASLKDGSESVIKNLRTGTYTVTATETDGTAVGCYLGDEGGHTGNVRLQSGMKFVVDGALAIGAYVGAEAESSSIAASYYRPTFVVGSSGKNSLNKEAYGIITDNAYVNMQGCDISIDSSASVIIGSYLNSWRSEYHQRLKVSIKAKNADTATAELIRAAHSEQETAFNGFVLLHASLEPIRLDPYESQFTVTGSAKSMFGICYIMERDWSSSETPEIEITDCTISITNTITDAQGLSSSLVGVNGGVLVDYRRGGSGGKIDDINISNCTIKVACKSTARETAYVTASAVELYGITCDDIDITGSIMEVDTSNLEAGNQGIKLNVLSQTTYSDIDISENVIKVVSQNEKNGANCTYGIDLEASSNFYASLESNVVTVSAQIAIGVYLHDKRTTFINNTVNVNGFYVSHAVDYVSEIKLDTTFRDSSLCATVGSDTDVSCYGVYYGHPGGEDKKLIFENCTIKALAEKSSSGNVAALVVSNSGTKTNLDLKDSTILLKSKSTDCSAIRGAVASFAIENTKIESTGDGINLTCKKESSDIRNSSVKAAGYCVNVKGSDLNTCVYVYPETVLETTGASGVWAATGAIFAAPPGGDASYLLVNRAGSQLAAIDVLEEKYVKMTDSLPVSIELVTAGGDGSTLFSTNGRVEAKLTLPEGYTRVNSGTSVKWELTRGDYVYQLSNSFTLLGNKSNLAYGTNHITFTADIAYTNASVSSTVYHRTVVVEADIVKNPEYTFCAYPYNATEAQKGVFPDGTDKMVIVVAYDTDVIAPANPTKTGERFNCWKRGGIGGYTFYGENAEDDTTLYAQFVPTGTYIKKKLSGGTSEVVTSRTADGKYILLDDQEYTGSAIYPTGYTVCYGDGWIGYLNSGDGYDISQYFSVKYKNNKDIGTASIVLTPKKGYKNFFSGSVTLKFNIVPAHAAPVGGTNVVDYTGKKINFSPTLKHSNQDIYLKMGKDFSITEIKYMKSVDDIVKVSEIKKTGLYNITYKCSKAYSYDTGYVILVVTDSNIKLTAAMVSVENIEYTGTAYCPGQAPYADKLIVNNVGTILSPGTDYQLYYRAKGAKTFSATYKPIEIGTYEVKIVGAKDNGYTGEVIKEFKITGIDISGMQLNFLNNLDGLTYSPYRILMELCAFDGAIDSSGNTVTDLYKKNAVESGGNCEVSFKIDKTTYRKSDYVKAGKVTMIVTGKGKYYGTIKKSFTVKKLDLATAYNTVGKNTNVGVVSVNYSTTSTYNPNGATSVNNIYVGTGTDLKSLSECRITYKNNKKVGIATATIQGKGSCTGKITIQYRVVPAELDDDTDGTASNRSISKKAGDYTTSIALYSKIYSKKLKAGTDYSKSVIYRDEQGNVLGKNTKLKAGQTISVTLTGTGNYTGTKTLNFKVMKAGIAGSTVTAKKKTMGTAPIILTKDDITVKHKTYGKLVYGKDYIVTYVDDSYVAKGKVDVTIEGVGEYAGTIHCTVTVGPTKL